MIPVTHAGDLLRGPWLGKEWDRAAAAVMLGLLLRERSADHVADPVRGVDVTWDARLCAVPNALDPARECIEPCSIGLESEPGVRDERRLTPRPGVKTGSKAAAWVLD